MRSLLLQARSSSTEVWVRFQVAADTSALSNWESWKWGLEKKTALPSLAWSCQCRNMTSVQLWGRHFSRSGSIFSGVQRFCQDMIVLVSGERLCGFLRRAETLSAQLRVGSEGTFCVLHKLLQNVGMQNWKTVPSLLRDVYFKDLFCITMFLFCWWNRCFCRAKTSIKFCWSCLRCYSPANCPVPVLEQAYSRAAGRWCMYLTTLLQSLLRKTGARKE